MLPSAMSSTSTTTPDIEAWEKIYRCVSWVAVSSEPQAERESPKDQRQRNQEFIENLGRYYPNARGILIETLEMAATRSYPFLQNAIEGHSTYARLVELIRTRAFDVLVCRSRDRLGRTATLIGELERLCSQYDIVVVPRMSPPASLDLRELHRSEGNMMLSAIEAVMAETEIRRLVNRNEIGMRGRVVGRKLFANGVPFGYRYHYDERGRETIEIDPAAASVIRLVLIDLYLRRGWGGPRIIDYLRKHKLPSPGGKGWNQTGQFDHLIRMVRRYAGYLEHNKYSKSGRTRQLVKADYPPILTEAEMNEILEHAAIRKRTYTGDAGRRPFAGIAICAECGKTMIGRVTYHNGRAGRSAYYGMRCPDAHASIADNKLRLAVKGAIEWLQSLDDLHPVAHSTSENRLKHLEMRINGCIASTQDANTSRLRLMNAYFDHGSITTEEFMTRIKEIEERIAFNAAEIERLQRERDQELARADSLKRLEDFRSAGLQMLERIDTNPHQVRHWLQHYIRVYVGKKGKVTRIEFR